MGLFSIGLLRKNDAPGPLSAGHHEQLKTNIKLHPVSQLYEVIIVWKITIQRVLPASQQYHTHKQFKS